MTKMTQFYGDFQAQTVSIVKKIGHDVCLSVFLERQNGN